MGSKPRIGNPSLTYSDHGLCAITTVSRPRVLLRQAQIWLVPQAVSGGETDPRRPRAQPKRPSFMGNGIYQGFNSKPGCDHAIAVQILILGSKATAGPVYQLRRLQVPQRSAQANVVQSYRWKLRNGEEFKYDVSLWLHIHADVCSSFEDQKQPAAPRTAFPMPVEICTAHADRIGKTDIHVKEI